MPDTLDVPAGVLEDLAADAKLHPPVQQDYLQAVTEGKRSVDVLKRRQEFLNGYQPDEDSQYKAGLLFDADEQLKADSAATAYWDQREAELRDYEKQFSDPYEATWRGAVWMRKRDIADRVEQRQSAEDARERQNKMLDYAGSITQSLGGGNAFTDEARHAATQISGTVTGLLARGADVVAPTGPVGEASADALNRDLSLWREAQAQNRRDDWSPELSKAYGGGLESLGKSVIGSVVAGPYGTYGAIGLAGLDSANQAITEGYDSGLRGVDLAVHATAQGGLEAGIAALFQMKGFGGAESLAAGKIVANSYKQLGKQALVQGSAELVEENTTSLLQRLASRMTGVTPELKWEDVANDLKDVSGQTAFTMGLGNVPNAIRVAAAPKYQRDMANRADQGEFPSDNVKLKRVFWGKTRQEARDAMQAELGDKAFTLKEERHRDRQLGTRFWIVGVPMKGSDADQPEYQVGVTPASKMTVQQLNAEYDALAAKPREELSASDMARATILTREIDARDNFAMKVPSEAIATPADSLPPGSLPGSVLEASSTGKVATPTVQTPVSTTVPTPTDEGSVIQDVSEQERLLEAERQRQATDEAERLLSAQGASVAAPVAQVATPVETATVPARTPAAAGEQEASTQTAAVSSDRASQWAGQQPVHDLGQGVSITTQKAADGSVVPVTVVDSSREMIHVTKDGKGVWFYRSFAGTGGKQQGRWYPVGGLAKDPKGATWIIKGDVSSDKAFGRSDLAALEDYINDVLPSDDAGVDEFFKQLGVDSLGVAGPEKSTDYEVEDLSSKDAKAQLLNQWKQERLNPTWGQRKETSNAQQVPSTAETDASGSPRPEVRQESRNPPVSRAGVPTSGPSESPAAGVRGANEQAPEVARGSKWNRLNASGEPEVAPNGNPVVATVTAVKDGEVYAGRGAEPLNDFLASHTPAEGPSVMKVSQLSVDPKRFQYKLNTDESGVTTQFGDVEEFNPLFAGVIHVWFDPTDQKTYVVNGHHRYELAKRAGFEGDLRVFQINAPNAQLARAYGAVVNIADGNGTSVDAAKFLRDTELTMADLARLGISPSGQMAKEATALSRLSPNLFDRLTQGLFDKNRALAIATHVGKPEDQERLTKHIEQYEERTGREATDGAVEQMAKKMSLAGKRTHIVKDLFGEAEVEDSTFVERAELEAGVRRGISESINKFRAVSTQKAAKTLEGANVIDATSNKAEADRLSQLLEDFDRETTYSGPVSDAFNEAARRLADAPSKRSQIIKELGISIPALLQDNTGREGSVSGTGSQSGEVRAEARQEAEAGRKPEPAAKSKVAAGPAGAAEAVAEPADINSAMSAAIEGVLAEKAKPKRKRSKAGEATEKALAAAKAKADKSFDEFVEATKKAGSTAVLDPTIQLAAAKLLVAHVDLGVKKFADFVVMAAERISDATVRKFGPYLEAGWRDLKDRNLVQDDPTPVDDVLAARDAKAAPSHQGEAQAEAKPESPAPPEKPSDADDSESPPFSAERTWQQLRDSVDDGDIDGAVAIIESLNTADALDVAKAAGFTDINTRTTKRNLIETVRAAAEGLTGVSNAIVGVVRKLRGEEPPKGTAPQTWDQWLQSAAQRINENDAWVPGLISQLLIDPAAITAVEQTGLNIWQRMKHNALDAAQKDFDRAKESGDLTETVRLQAVLTGLAEELTQFAMANKSAGETTARALGSRAMWLRTDMSYESLLHRAIAANNGNPISPETSLKLKEQSTRYAEAEKQYQEAKAKEQAAQSKRRFDKGIRKTIADSEKEKADPQTHRKRAANRIRNNAATSDVVTPGVGEDGDSARQFVDSVRANKSRRADTAQKRADAQAAAAQARKQVTADFQNALKTLDDAIKSSTNAPIPLTKEIFDAFVKLSVSLVKAGVKTFQAFLAELKTHDATILSKASENSLRDAWLEGFWRSSEIEPVTFDEVMESAVQELGQDVADSRREALHQAWEDSNDSANPFGDILGKVDWNDNRSVAKAAKKIARRLVDNGVRGVEEITDGMHRAFLSVAPHMTREQVWDAFGDYHEYHRNTKSEEAAELAHVRSVIQKTRQLQDLMRSGQAFVIGGARDELTADARRLIRDINDEKRLIGPQPVSDEKKQSRMKTQQDAKKRQLEHEIEDLDLALEKKLPMNRERNAKRDDWDDEVNALIAERDQKKKEYLKLFPPQRKAGQSLSDEQWLKQALASAARMEKFYQDRLAADIAGVPRPVKQQRPTNADLDAARDRRDAAKAEGEYYSAWLAEGESLKQSNDPQHIAELFEKDLKRREQEAFAALLAAEDDLAAAELAPKRTLKRLQVDVDAAREDVAKIRKEREQWDKGQVSTENQALALRHSARNKSTESRLLNEAAAIQDRIDRLDFAEKLPDDTYQPNRAVNQARLKRDTILKTSRDIIEAERKRNRTRTEAFKEGFNWAIDDLARYVALGLDLSTTLLQGGAYLIANPKQIPKAIKSGAMSAWNAEYAERVIEELESREGFKNGRYARHGINPSAQLLGDVLASVDTVDLPVFRNFQRGVSAMMALVKANAADALSYSVAGPDGSLTKEQDELIKNAVNVFTGTGSTQTKLTFGTALSSMLLAPSWVLSRHKLLLGQPLWYGLTTMKADYVRRVDQARASGDAAALTKAQDDLKRVTAEMNAVRRAIALRFYGQFAAGIVGTQLLYAIARWMTDSPEDKEKEGIDSIFDYLVLNPASKNFGRLKIGGKYYDMSAGVLPTFSMWWRIVTGRNVDSLGAEKDNIDRIKPISEYFRGKLSPKGRLGLLAGELITSGYDSLRTTGELDPKFLSGQRMLGSKKVFGVPMHPALTVPLELAEDFFLNATVKSVWESYRRNGLSPVMAASILDGLGAQSRNSVPYSEPWGTQSDDFEPYRIIRKWNRRDNATDDYVPSMPTRTVDDPTNSLRRSYHLTGAEYEQYKELAQQNALKDWNAMLANPAIDSVSKSRRNNPTQSTIEAIKGSLKRAREQARNTLEAKWIRNRVGKAAK